MKSLIRVVRTDMDLIGIHSNPHEENVNKVIDSIESDDIPFVSMYSYTTFRTEYTRQGIITISELITILNFNSYE